ncbi:hypothetical protein [Arundinibacter roseus]|uniref:Uncharacterized protein n=1 Tax=Arundinibacter roseus TaxID=2070510 RepID=A0A4R4KKM9_9BACT|nr:hypothetical protein [Arundinibacter roseus]TDB68817.1 hypothetical protein EZE20_00270 [Arundinibacter roseus]
MKNRIAIILALIITCFYGCIPKQDCPPTRSLTFRGVEISFPVTGLQVLKKQKDVFFVSSLLSTSKTLYDPSKNTTIWFLETTDYPYPTVDTVEFLREREAYGITFALLDERNLTDQEMAEKVKKELNLPGEFVLKTKPGRAFYHYQEGCLSIITSLLADSISPYPQVSFCYGFKEDELFYYSSTPGQRASD